MMAAPPTRGWTPVRPIRAGVHIGCPAYAGMDRYKGETHFRSVWLPRLRGDGPEPTTGARSAQAAAPPTRGWTLVPRDAALSSAGCPAYAGMDPRWGLRLPAGFWLPRLRGDGPASLGRPSREGPAAPPTRGWTQRDIRA